MNVGDKVELRVDYDMGTWDIPAGKVGWVIGFKGNDAIVEFDQPLHGVDESITLDVKPTELRPAPRAQSRRKS